MIYPRNVYKSPGPNRLPRGESFSLLSVSDQKSHENALDDGYFDTVPEAINAPVDENWNTSEAVVVTKPRRGRPPKEA